MLKACIEAFLLWICWVLFATNYSFWWPTSTIVNWSSPLCTLPDILLTRSSLRYLLWLNTMLINSCLVFTSSISLAWEGLFEGDFLLNRDDLCYRSVFFAEAFLPVIWRFRTSFLYEVFGLGLLLRLYFFSGFSSPSRLS